MLSSSDSTLLLPLTASISPNWLFSHPLCFSLGTSLSAFIAAVISTVVYTVVINTCRNVTSFTLSSLTLHLPFLAISSTSFSTNHKLVFMLFLLTPGELIFSGGAWMHVALLWLFWATEMFCQTLLLLTPAELIIRLTAWKRVVLLWLWFIQVFCNTW